MVAFGRILILYFMVVLVGVSLNDASENLTLSQKNPNNFTVDFSLVHQLHCGNSTGTGVMVGPNTMITAYHVTVEGNGRCLNQNFRPVTTYSEDPDKDFVIARVEGPGTDRSLPYSCDGFKPGRTYFTIGYADGTNLQLNKLKATHEFTPRDHMIQGSPAGHLRMLRGNLHVGMSGGPIIDQNGFIVGMNQAKGDGGYAFSREIKDTVLCKKRP